MSVSQYAAVSGSRSFALAVLADGRESEAPSPALGGVVVPDHPVIRALFGALMAGGARAAHTGWLPAGASVLNVQRIGQKAIEICLEAGSAEDAWREAQAISPLALDVLALLVSCPSSLDDGRLRLLRAANLLEAKGCRRWGEERRGLESHIGAEMQRLRRISLGAHGPLLFDLTPVGPRHCDFVYQPGAWLRSLWESAGRCVVHPQVLHFDHRNNRGADVLAKKLALHFTFLTGASRRATRSVRSVLNAVGVATDDLASRGGRGGRLAERFEEAILRLHECQLFRARYTGSDASLTEQRLKGWVRSWLGADMVIEQMSPWRDVAQFSEATPVLGPRQARLGATQ